MRGDPMMNNDEILKAVVDIDNRIESFVTQYETDMRGDKNLGNGNSGVIGEIRKIQKYINDYPTIAYQFSKNPVKVIGYTVAIFLLLMTLYTAGMLEIIAKTFGL
jgi:hypothetical protein